MILFRRRLLLSLLRLSDPVILGLAWAMSRAWEGAASESVEGMGHFQSTLFLGQLFLLATCLLLWHISFSLFGLYHSRRLGYRLQECKDIVKATTLGCTLIMVVGQLFGVASLTGLSLLSLWGCSTVLTLLFRLTLRAGLGLIRRGGRNLRQIVVLGTNRRAHRFADTLAKRPDLGYRVMGYLDTRIHESRPGLQLLGGLDDLRAILRAGPIDEVIIALPIKSFYRQIENSVAIAEEQGVLVRHLSNLFETRVARASVEMLDGFTVTTLDAGIPLTWQFMVKRGMDMVISTLILIVILPLLLLVALMIKLNSPGPVLFAQDRVGYNKHVFRLYKFRTMVADAESLQHRLAGQNEMDGPVFKMRHDPRVTTLGQWLRRTSIDELPQLFNVLKGDMSLVGPRPLPLRDYQGFDQDWQRRRFSVLPGITCTWQIGGRNNISFENWMRLDMEYIDNWRLSRDIAILLRTVGAVLSGRGAV